MNRLILDYFRRWWWVLALACVLEFGLGWFIVSVPEQNFEFWGLLLAMWVGANLVSFDLRRGILRAVAVWANSMPAIADNSAGVRVSEGVHCFSRHEFGKGGNDGQRFHTERSAYPYR